MGHAVKGGMWCDQCQRPVAAQKTTHGVRNFLAATLYAPTAGGSLAGGKIEDWHCPYCGGPVRRNRPRRQVTFRSDTGRALELPKRFQTRAELEAFATPLDDGEFQMLVEALTGRRWKPEELVQSVMPIRPGHPIWREGPYTSLVPADDRSSGAGEVDARSVNGGEETAWDERMERAAYLTGLRAL